MLALLLIIISAALYLALKIPRVLKNKKELQKIEQEKLKSKMKAEKLKKKVESLKK